MRSKTLVVLRPAYEPFADDLTGFDIGATAQISLCAELMAADDQTLGRIRFELRDLGGEGEGGWADTVGLAESVGVEGEYYCFCR